jgi:hypothetical protein
MRIITDQSKVSLYPDSLISCALRLLTLAEQNFGVDLEARARADRKRVPILVTTLLTYLDNRKPTIPLSPTQVHFELTGLLRLSRT